MLKSLIDVAIIKDGLRKNENTVMPIHYTQTEKSLISRFNIDITKRYNPDYIGHVNYFNPLETLKMIGNNTEEDVQKMADIIKRLAQEVCNGYGRKYVWVSIRANNPIDIWDVPRWHTDGNFFINPKSRTKQQSKFITVLKGAGTLMIHPQPNNEIIEKIAKLWSEIRNNYKEQMSIEFRKKYDAILVNENKKQLNNEQGLVFMVGNRDRALIHSEPPMREDRLFISILPGYEYEITELNKRWNKN
jgi:hypothetical protein